MKKRILSLFLIFILFCVSVPVHALDAPPSVTSKAAIIVDYDTGFMIYGKNPDARRAPASMTKMMSLYSFFSRMNGAGITLDTPVTISKSIAALSVKPGLSNVPLGEGEVHSVDTLIRAACIVSANAAIVALGSLVAGSEEAFVQAMNADAAALGLDAGFRDPAGLNDNNFITPRSMAELCRIIIREYPQILTYTSLKTFTFKGRTYASTNQLLDGLSGSYPGTDGLKTGYIGVAGYCLCATSKREGRRVIAVTMGSSGTNTRTSDGYALLRYGFRNIEEIVEPIYGIRADFSTENGVTMATLKNVPASFNASVRWFSNGETIARHDSVHIENGTKMPAYAPQDGLELVISVGPYNVLVRP